MNIKEVWIKDTTTGEARPCCQGYEWFGDFIWEEGNYACDCNRQLFFERSVDPEWDTDEEHTCGDGRYLIMSIYLEDGSVVYSESPLVG